MAIYHLSVKCISRSHGRSATAAAAYRSAAKIHDERTGELHDYLKKGGVSFTQIVLPDKAPDWAHDREQLWNRAELAETRRNSTVAREFEVALPDELGAEARRELALELARNITERHGCAADVAIHEPGREGDLRNHHAHILCTTRRLAKDGFAEKTRELDEKKTGEVDQWRQRWATLTNDHLKRAGLEITVDHRSLADQGIERTPTKHLGPVVAERLRRGKDSYVAERIREERLEDANERLRLAREAGQLDREERGLTRAILDTETTLKAALAHRDAQWKTAKQPPLAEPVRDPDERREQAQILWLDARTRTSEASVNADSSRQLIIDPGRDR